MTQDLLTQLAEYGTYHEELQAPLTINEIVGANERVQPTPRPTRPMTPRPNRHGLLAAAVAALLVVLVIGGFALWGGGGGDVVEPRTTTSIAPSSTTIPPPTTVAPPTTIPPPTTVAPPTTAAPPTTVPLRSLPFSDVFPTALGDVRVTVIQGDPTQLPWGPPVTTPEGFAAVGADGGLMVSTNRIDWVPAAEPVPAPLLQLESSEDGYRAETDAGAVREWVSADLVTWQPDPFGFVPPLVVSDDLPVDAHRQGDAPTNDSGVTLGRWVYDLDWRSLILDLGGEDLQAQLDEGFALATPAWESDTETTGTIVARVFEPFSNESLVDEFPPIPAGVRIRASIAGTVAEWVMAFENEATGQPLGTVEGTVPVPSLGAAIEQLATGGDLETFVVREPDGSFTPVRPNWVTPGDEIPGTTLLSVGDTFVALVEPGATMIWASDDGRSWDPIGEAPWDPEVEDFDIAESNGVLVLAGWAEGDEEFFGLMRSTDGINWSVGSGLPTGVNGVNGVNKVLVHAMGSGFVFVAEQWEGDFAVWASADGTFWEPLDLPGVPLPHLPRFRRFGYAGVVGGTDSILVRVEPDDRRSTVWVFEPE